MQQEHYYFDYEMLCGVVLYCSARDIDIQMEVILGMEASIKNTLSDSVRASTCVCAGVLGCVCLYVC